MYSQYSIGRSSDCDILLQDATVSKLHAELVVSKLNRLFISDCNSSGGTYVCNERGKFEKVSQTFIEPNQLLLLGEWQGTATFLLSQIVKQSSEHTGEHSDEQELMPSNDLPSGRVRRDPVTGEIVAIEEGE